MVAANDIFRDTSFMGGLGDFEFSEQYLGLTAGLNEANPVGDTTSDPQLFSDLASTANTPTVEHEAARLGLGCVAIPVMLRGRSAAVPAYVGERVNHNRGISDRVTDIAHGARPDGISQCQCNVGKGDLPSAVQIPGIGRRSEMSRPRRSSPRSASAQRAWAMRPNPATSSSRVLLPGRRMQLNSPA